MCSGSCERGNRIAPASGKIGTRRISALFTLSPASRKEERRQPPPLAPRPRVLEPLRLEKLQESLARGALVPLAVAADDLEQFVGGGVAVAGRHPRPGQLEAGVEIVGVGGDPGLDRRGVD